MPDMPHVDRPALLRHRARAAHAPARFLREAVAGDVEERLLEVNRRFTAAAIVTPMPEIWRGRLPGARMVPDDPVLDLVPGAHDLVIHDLSLHWAEDPVGQIVQCARALTPDGMFLGTLFGAGTLGPLRAALAEAEVAATGGLSPRVAPLGEIRELGGLIGRGGLALPVADAQDYDVSYADALALMRDLRAMGEANAIDGRVRRFTGRAVILGAAALYPREADGRVRARFEVVTLTGWAPSASQPKALRRGSATHSLADALAQAVRREE